MARAREEEQRRAAREAQERAARAREEEQRAARLLEQQMNAEPDYSVLSRNRTIPSNPERFLVTNRRRLARELSQMNMRESKNPFSARASKLEESRRRIAQAEHDQQIPVGLPPQPGQQHVDQSPPRRLLSML